MIRINEQTRTAFLSDVSHKTMRIVFPELNITIGNDRIESESFKLTESISSKDSVEYVGCIASTLQVNIYGLTQDIKGKRIEAYIKADNTEEIPLFKGIVDSAVIDSNRFFKKITAYDVLYLKGDLDVSAWYYSQFPTDESTRTIKQLRDSLFSYIGITQVDKALPNDAIVIGKKFQPVTLKCITVLKSLCQFNGCCGIIDRYGKFDFRFIYPVYEGLYPTFYPGANVFPQKPNIAQTFRFYGSLDFEEYYVKPMARVQFRESEKDSGVTAGAESGNKYIIQSNMFAQGLVPSVAMTAATNILKKLKAVNFYPFNSKTYGMPFVEVGDCVRFVLSQSAEYQTNSFTVLTRTLSGVQILNDSYSAVGDEEQSEFITDIQAQIETLQMNGGGGGGDLSDYYTKEETMDILDTGYFTQEQTIDNVSEQVNQLETPTGFNVVSVYTLPSIRQANTIYLVQGGVVML